MPAYKDKKGNSWYAKFNYKNWKGETKFTTKRGFPTKRAAVEYEREFKLHIAGDLDMNFEEFVKLYREDLYPRIRVSTAATKDHIINTKLIPYFKNFKVTEIKAKDIVKWQNELLSYRNPETGKPYMKTYLKTVHNQMNAIMNFAVKYYDLKDNPVEKAGSIGISNAEEMKFWVLDEYLQFSEAMMEEPFFYYCFEVLYWCGLREGELLALTYDDFDFVNKTISITKTYQIVNKEEVIGPTKTPKLTNRDVVVVGNPRVFKALKTKMEGIYNELLRINSAGEVNEQLLDSINLVAKIYAGMIENGKGDEV